MPIRNRFADTHTEITGWRRHLHQNPELMFDLPQTAKFVADRLRGFGISEITTGVAQSGVVAVIEGKTNTSGRTIGLRADMDALPIHEVTGLDYASGVAGKMHACGHDGHTAMLLGAAEYLAGTRNFDGRVVLIFQPAEEGGGGADVMVKEGLMDRWSIDEVYGMHNVPGLPVGSYAIRSGPLLASSDEFEIVVTGRGGHAAEPQEAIDTTLVGAHIVVALQSIVSRNVGANKRVVLTVGTFETDSTASNIIAHTVRMKGTVRTLDPEWREKAQSRIRRLVGDIASGFEAQAEVTWQAGYPVTINWPDQTGYAIEAAQAVSDNVDTSVDPIMPSEDFSYMLEARPGAYMFIGNGDTASCHHPAYNFDDAAIPFGCSWFVELVERRMPAA